MHRCICIWRERRGACFRAPSLYIYMCVYVYVCMYVYICMHVCMHMHKCICSHTSYICSACILLYTHIRLYIHTHMHTPTHISYFLAPLATPNPYAPTYQFVSFNHKFKGPAARACLQFHLFPGSPRNS
jgi:hypothetical protein